MESSSRRARLTQGRFGSASRSGPCDHYRACIVGDRLVKEEAGSRYVRIVFCCCFFATLGVNESPHSARDRLCGLLFVHSPRPQLHTRYSRRGGVGAACHIATVAHVPQGVKSHV